MKSLILRVLCAAVVCCMSRLSMFERPIIYNLFLQHLPDDIPFLRISTTCSDFWDKRITLRATNKFLTATYVRVFALYIFLQIHVRQSGAETRI